MLLERPNRFLGIAGIEGKAHRIHIPDPGRLGELLYSGARILLKHSGRGGGRKTAWTLMAAAAPVGGEWVLTNTFLHRRIATELISSPAGPFDSIAGLKAEVVVGNSRLDFMITHHDGVRRYVEVKGCTLVSGDTCLFPDAPTARGRRHMQELSRLAEEGFRSTVLFLVMARAVRVAPNEATDPHFSQAFRRALSSGVEAIGHRISYDGRTVSACGEVSCCAQGVDGIHSAGRFKQ